MDDFRSVSEQIRQAKVIFLLKTVKHYAIKHMKKWRQSSLTLNFGIGYRGATILTPCSSTPWGKDPKLHNEEIGRV
jgi:hypothetical protein